MFHFAKVIKMEIIINGKQAFLKKNTSFDFIFENRLFTGSDSYTLTITFPLKGCARNIAIFGHIHRADVIKSKVVFDCDIRDGAFLKSGSITITEISDVEVKTQFLEGRSEQNFDETFDDIYLNEMDLGYPTKRDNLIAAEAFKPYPTNNWVPLPWVNNYSGNLQNAVTTSVHFITGFENVKSTLSFQPYLLYILKRICSQLGYEANFAELEQSQYKYLLICNTLPAAWAAWNFAIALPHWTLNEFFEHLENFLFGDFDINHKAKRIEFHFSNSLAKSAGDVILNKVLDSYTTEVSQEDESKYIASANLKYADNDALLWSYYSCDWFIRANKSKALVYDTFRELIDKAMTLKISGYYKSTGHSGHGYSESFSRGYPVGSDGNRLFYCKEIDTYFIMYCYKSEFVSKHNGMKWYKYYNRLMPVNQFGDYFVDNDADDIELKIVPAWIEGTDDKYGNCMFLDCGELGSRETWTISEDGTGSSGSASSGIYIGQRPNNEGQLSSVRYHDDVDYDAGDLAQGTASYVIGKGETEKSSAYFDVIYVGFWSGHYLFGGNQPHPIIDKVEVTDSFGYNRTQFTLRLKDGIANSMRLSMQKIDGKQKFHFSFLSDTIPNPRALFYIRGQRYICEKITATFHESGKSQLLKGIFYRVLAD